MLKIIPAYTDGKSGALAPLSDAINIKIHKEINDLTSLEFDLSNDDNKLFILNEAENYWIYDSNDEQCYFVIDISASTDTHLTHFTCRHVINLLDIDNIIPDFPIMVGVNAKTIIQTGLNLINNEFFSLYDDSELEGDEQWVSDLTDVLDGYEKITMWGLIKEVIELIGYGELKYNNGKFAIVKRLGQSTDIYWSPGKNIERLSKAYDYSNIQNKILVLGASDMPLDVNQYPGSIITSEASIEKYGARYGVAEYSDITDKEELAAKGLFLFSEDNPERVDIPRISLDVKAYELNANKAPNLGDDVRIICKELNVDEYRRIVSVDFYPLQPLQSTYTIGETRDTVEKVISKTFSFASLLQKISRTNKIKSTDINNLSKNYNVKNMISNSTFANDDKHWTGEGYNFDNANALNGDGCATLIPGAYIEQEVDLSNITTNGIILTFGYKGEGLSVELSSNDELISHKSMINSEKQTITTFPYTESYKSYNAIYFYKSDTNGKVTVKISNNGGLNALLDNVMLSDNTGAIPMYTDGYDSKKSSSEGGGGGTVDLTQNIFYDMITQQTVVSSSGHQFLINIPKINNMMTGVMTLSLNISGLSSGKMLSIAFKADDKVVGSIMKGYNSPGDVETFTFTIPFDLSIQEGDNVLKCTVKEMSGSSMVLFTGSNLSAILSPKTGTRELLTSYEVGNTVPSNVIASVYRLSDGGIETEIKGNVADDVSSALWTEFARTSSSSTYFKSSTILTISDNVKSVPAGFCSGHTMLKTVKGLSKLTEQEDLSNAFFGCSKLEEVDGLPKNLSVALSTFENCTNLKTAPSISTTNKNMLWQRTFANSGITEYTYPITVNAGLYETFMGCSKLVKGPTALYFNDDGNTMRAFSGCSLMEGEMEIVDNRSSTFDYLAFDENMFEGVTNKFNLICDASVERNIRYTWTHTDILINGSPL